MGILMQVPLVGIYLPSYDALREVLPQHSSWSPMVAAAAARTAAVVATSPFEFVRVRVQAAGAAAAACTGAGQATCSPNMGAYAGYAAGRGPGSGASTSSLLRQVATGVVAEASALPSWRQRAAFPWTGCGASLAKDLPFAAIYFSLLEPARAALLRLLHQQQQLLPQAPGPAAAAGQRALSTGTAGMGAEPYGSEDLSLFNVAAANAAAAAVTATVASCVTQPLDVVKTKLQVVSSRQPCGAPVRILPALKALAAKGGLRALFSGLGPRVVRTSAAYAIVMASYEVAKSAWAPHQGW